jgi:hypothetical protein
MIISNPLVYEAFRNAYLQELMDIKSYIVVNKLRVETSKIGIVDVLENERWCFALHQVLIVSYFIKTYPSEVDLLARL